MDDDGLITARSPLPLCAHPRASERFHCFKGTPSQPEYKCKSKCLDTTDGSCSKESIIVYGPRVGKPRVRGKVYMPPVRRKGP